MSEHAAQPIGGNLWTKGYQWLAAILGLGILLMLWRFVAGLGATTALNDGYAWGLWIAFDVVTGTALGCGGYAVALLVYILNKGKYHPLVRPAVLTSALGYSMAAFAIIVDVGRYWYIFKIPVVPHLWNLNSALLEVALCVMSYVAVLWIEMAPAFLEKWKDSPVPLLKKLSDAFLPLLNKLLFLFIAVGVLLPTMHQSSLGTVMLLAGHKLHALWFTPWIPLLFLISCIAMGYGVVVMESTLSSRAFKRPYETQMLASLSGAASIVLFIYVGLRLLFIVIEGKIALVFTSGLMSLFFWLEMALFLVPAFVLANRKARESLATLFQMAMLIVLAGGLYRFDTYLVAFNPGDHFSYFPSVPEQVITVSIVALEIMLYVWLVKRFPILSGAPSRAGAKGGE